MRNEWVHLFKLLMLMILPFAGWLGTWVGFAAAGMGISSVQYLVIFVFALWTTAGVFAYFASERRRMNRNLNYR
jgi:predicted permease